MQLSQKQRDFTILVTFSLPSPSLLLKFAIIRLTTITNDIKSDSIGQYLAAYKIKLLQTCHSLYKSVAKQNCQKDDIEILSFKFPGIFHFQNLLLRENEQYVARKLFDSSNERLFGGNQEFWNFHLIDFLPCEHRFLFSWLLAATQSFAWIVCRVIEPRERLR